MEKHGIPFTQRFVPEEGLNQTFREKLGNHPATKKLGHSRPAKLSVQSVGQFDTLAFAPVTTSEAEIQAGFVEVEVKSIGLNAKVGCFANTRLRRLMC